ncbi:ACS family glucarate transporter-like MFS transporter [Sporomusaceae bacterium BoRhaA]|uniref:MFS transporter n=1 Tax=Pelorhabdus rhamnosifermentans TaxID=2772457 RepID=UPI001C062F59|nr:MFS transporter [Pelorhabdus rhamnosifermentans]MBU2704190.1 ACS family glucarate transporter-like MFS transporter [Pelorhabdus rhamnosifermentans]
MTTSSVDSKRTHIRYYILVMLFIVTTFNYADRATLSMAATAIKNDLAVDTITMGVAFSAFGWAYTAMQLPGGWLLDKFGSRFVYGVGLFLWSLFTFLQGTVGFFTGLSAISTLFLLRFLMGVAEAPAFPANSRITAMWFPTHERGFASAIFNSAQYFALAVFNPIMGWVLVAFGWRHVFYFVGMAGIILAMIWFKVIRTPHEHSGVNQAELDYIQSGGGLANVGDNKSEIKWSYVKALITNRMLLGVYFGQFCLNTITWFFLTWFPTYLVQAKGMSILKVGLVAAIPAICGFIGGLLGGYVSDSLLRHGKSLSVARKAPIIIGLTMSGSIILANYVTTQWVVIAVMALAFFSKGFGALGWSVVSDTSPKEMLGLSGGIFNFIGNMASIVTPIVIGYILNVTHSFNGALIFVGAMGILGALSYLVVVGEIKRVELRNIKED